MLKFFINWLAWPGLLATALLVSAFADRYGQLMIGFNATYGMLAVTLLLLERHLPHERDWLASDGQWLADIAHTLLSKGVVQTLIVFSATIGLTRYVTPMAEPGYSVWPRDWHLAWQVILGIVIAEFALYWAHRISHEWPPMWRFHAIHHSVTKLWVVNTGRFHFIDSLKSILPSTLLLLALGAPMEVLTWFSIVTAYIGILTHCNIDMRFGWLSYVFNTPELHRWHHSMDLREGNKNYSENIMLWDHLFGTFFIERHRRPPVTIGIREPMPQRFHQQLVWPFRRAS